MDEATIIGIDLAKNVFHLHGVSADGHVVFRKKLSRSQFERFMADQTPCVAAMEACGSAHFWARRLAAFGHEVRLIAPAYVKPFVKRQKNDAADAEAVAEAALRPTMRFVTPKTPEQQARAVVFRLREQMVGQRTELINAMRAHLYEFGLTAPQGVGALPKIAALLEGADDLPPLVRRLCRDLLDQIAEKTARIDSLTRDITAMSADAQMTRRLRTVPGIGPITALAIETFAPPMDSFECGRSFAAWLGLVPRQKSTGGKQRLGKVSKQGQSDIRRLLIVGAMSVVRAASRKEPPEDSWLARMLARKPRMLVAVALAAKMARAIWAMLTKDEDYRAPHAVT